MGQVVAVTGAAGNLGRILVDRLLVEGGISEIVALDLGPPDRVDDPRVRFVRSDVRDPDFGRHLAGCDALCHLAFIVETGSRDPALVEAVNVAGSKNVFEAAADAGVRSIVYASSIASYGLWADNAGRVIDETCPVRGNPDFYYSRNKAAVELWLDGFAARHPDISVARMRPSTFLGPRTTRDFADLLRLPVYPYVGGPAWPVHVTHEDDVADAFALALLRRARGAFNLAAARPLPSRAWGRAMGKPSIAIPNGLLEILDFVYRAGFGTMDPIWLKVGIRGPLIVSSERAYRELGWSPRFPTTASALRAVGGR